MPERGVRKTPVSLSRLRTRRCALEALESRRLLSSTIIATPAVANSGVTPGPSGYTPAQVLNAYGFDAAASSIGAVGGNGSGQTIAIVEAFHDVSLSTDLHAFDQQFSLADPVLTQVDQDGGHALPSSDSLWSTETALDVEWAHAVAPMAHIVVVEAKSAQISDLLTAVDTARNIQAVSIVSMSWGVSEFPNETAFDRIFTTPAGHQNVTFVASAGDTATADGVQWPAVSPNVVSVGGSSLSITFGGNYEAVYSGASSGESLYEPAPTYQSATSSAGGRTTPDVVYDASPTPGFAVYNSSASGWQTLGGTSGGAPQWAGLVAIANQVRVEAGLPTLNGSTQTLPALYNYYNANQQATIKSTSPNVKGISGALLSDTGAPQAQGVISALASNDASVPATRTKFGAESIATLIASAPRRKAHPLILNTPAPLPLLRFAAPFTHAKSDAPQLLASAGGFAATVVLDKTALSSGAMSTDTVAHSLLADALPEFVELPAAKVAAVSELMNAIYGEISALGTDKVVPVGVAAMLADPVRTSWFIAHINVAATFGDAFGAFINECDFLPPANLAAAAPAPHGHLRAWVVTLGVVAVDGIILYYLFSHHRRRQFIANSEASWF